MLEVDRGKLTEPLFVDFFKPYFAPVKEGILERFQKLAKAVDPQEKAGYHMCYGNYKQKHWLEPENVGLPVKLIDTLIDQVGPFYRVDYVHIPVPKNRIDLDYFLPL